MKLTEVSDLRIYKLLAKLNLTKACGSDEIPNLMLKECAETLAFTISRINSTSLQEQRLSRLWKLAHVSPLSKKTSEGP